MSSLIPPLFRGDMSLPLLLRAEMIVEWFRMVMAGYLLCNLASNPHTFVLPLGAILMLCIWK